MNSGEKIQNIYLSKKDALKLVSDNGLDLGTLSNAMKNDPDVVIQAVKKDYTALFDASPELLKDESFTQRLIDEEINALCFQFLDVSIRDNKRFASVFINRFPNNLSRTSDELKDNFDIVLSAVKQDGSCITYASSRLKDDEVIFLEAINQNESAYTHGSERLKLDERFVSLLYKKSIPVYLYVQRHDLNFPSVQSKLDNFLKNVVIDQKHLQSQFENINSELTKNKSLFSDNARAIKEIFSANKVPLDYILKFVDRQKLDNLKTDHQEIKDLICKEVSKRNILEITSDNKIIKKNRKLKI